MQHFIELWNARPAWKALSSEERQNYLDALGPAIQGLIESGVEILSWGINDQKTDQRANFDFFAVWSFPDENGVREFENAVAGSGWYDYFEQVNICGDARSAQDVMGDLINL